MSGIEHIYPKNGYGTAGMWRNWQIIILDDVG